VLLEQPQQPKQDHDQYDYDQGTYSQFDGSA
jgi:hypothetical protein